MLRFRLVQVCPGTEDRRKTPGSARSGLQHRWQMQPTLCCHRIWPLFPLRGWLRIGCLATERQGERAQGQVESQPDIEPTAWLRSQEQHLPAGYIDFFQAFTEGRTYCPLTAKALLKVNGFMITSWTLAQKLWNSVICLSEPGCSQGLKSNLL